VVRMRHAGRCRNVRLADHLYGIADEFRVRFPNIPRQQNGTVQRMPFSIGVRTNPQIVNERGYSTDHDGGLHQAGVRATTAIEEHFQPTLHDVLPFFAG